MTVLGLRCRSTQPTGDGLRALMSLWLTLAVNSIALGGLLFLLSSGFSLIFGLMRIPNLMHGSFFMLGAYFGVTLLWQGRQLLGRRAGERRRHGRDRRADRALPAAPAGGPGAAAGAADAGLRLHRRRCLPDAVDRRSLAARHARSSARRRAGGRPLLPDLPAGDRGWSPSSSPSPCGCWSTGRGSAP